MNTNLTNLNDSGQGNQNFNNKTISSREIAEVTGKHHKHVLTDCEKLNQNYKDLGLDEISADLYKDSYGRYQRQMQLTKMQSMDLMTGYSIPLRIKVNRRWEELELNNQVKAPSSLKEALMLALVQQEQLEAQQLLLEEQKPKVIFADAVSTSKTTVLIGELAKILKQNGIEIGQNRLFDWLRENGFLIVRKGSDYNMPTQRSMDLGLFEIKETSITHSDGKITISKTPKVTGKGQQYFVNKFLKK